MTVYQCCCIMRESALSFVEVTSGIPPQVRQFCEAAQNAVAAKLNQKRGLESLYEVLCDGDYVYVIQTALALRDRLGHSYAFSHAFIFPGREVLGNPDSFLSLSRDNFKTSREGARDWDGNYESLRRDSGMTLDEARKIAGAESPEGYQSLIYCAYAQMAQHKAPLFLRYDAPDGLVTEDAVNQQIRALLHCVWSGLPFFLRRQFSAVSSPGPGEGEFRIVLTKSRKPGPGVWNPSGPNPGILTSQTQSRIRRYRYLEYAAKALSGDSRALAAYYEWLDRKADEYGGNAGEILLKLLSQQYQHRPGGVDYGKSPALRCDPASFDDRELLDWLSDALRLPPFKGEEWRNVVDTMLKEARGRGLTLPNHLVMPFKMTGKEYIRYKERERRRKEQEARQQADEVPPQEQEVRAQPPRTGEPEPKTEVPTAPEALPIPEEAYIAIGWEAEPEADTEERRKQERSRWEAEHV